MGIRKWAGATLAVVLLVAGGLLWYRLNRASHTTGGDLCVSFAGSHWTPCIDAHPVRSGDFQHAATVDGREIFLTREGKAKFDEIAKDGYPAHVLQDSKGGRFKMATPKQYYVGQP